MSTHGLRRAARRLAVAACLSAAAGCAEAPPRIPTLFTGTVARQDRTVPPAPSAPPTAPAGTARPEVSRSSPAASPAAAGPTAALTAPATPWSAAPIPPMAPRSVPTSPAARELVLPNGLRILAVEHHARPVVVVALVLPHGSLSDPPEATGATSLAVQIVTDYREKTDTGEEDIEEKPLRGLIGERGATLDSGTTHDASWFHVTGYAADTVTYLTLLADAVRQPRHGERSFKGRRDARLDFIEDLQTSDDDALGKVMAEAAFGHGHPYARSVIGTHASLSGLGLEDVIRHQAAILVPEGATLLVVGDVEARQVLAAARAAFQGWRGRALPQPSVSDAPAATSRGRLGLLKRQPASTLVTCATRSLAGVKASDATLQLLAAMLGDGAASRLGRALREEHGHAYAVSAALQRRRHGRVFMACSPLGAATSGEGLATFRQALEAARAAPPSPAELAHARGLVQAELDASWDDTRRIAGAWVEALLLGEDRPRPERRRTELEAVTPDQLWRAAREVLRPETIRWVVSGEPAAAARAAEANGLGAPVALALER